MRMSYDRFVKWFADETTEEIGIEMVVKKVAREKDANGRVVCVIYFKREDGKEDIELELDHGTASREFAEELSREFGVRSGVVDSYFGLN